MEIDNHTEGLIALSWVDPVTGNYILTPTMLAVITGGGAMVGNQAPAPSPQMALQQQNSLNDIAIAKTLKKGERAHTLLQKRLKKKQERNKAISKVSAVMGEPTYLINIYIKHFIDHQKQEKKTRERAIIIEGMKRGHTNKQIAKQLGCHEKTIANRRRDIEREILEGAR